jgi:hypothetical protein
MERCTYLILVVRRERNESALTGSVAGLITQSLNVSIYDGSLPLAPSARDRGWTADAHTNDCTYVG